MGRHKKGRKRTWWDWNKKSWYNKPTTPTFPKWETQLDNSRVAVARGAALLDQVIPGWADHIDAARWEAENAWIPPKRPVHQTQHTVRESTACQSKPAQDLPPEVEVPGAKKAMVGCDANFQVGHDLLGLTKQQCQWFGFDSQPGKTNPVTLDEAWAEAVKQRNIPF